MLIQKKWFLKQLWNLPLSPVSGRTGETLAENDITNVEYIIGSMLPFRRVEG